MWTIYICMCVYMMSVYIYIYHYIYILYEIYEYSTSWSKGHLKQSIWHVQRHQIGGNQGHLHKAAEPTLWKQSPALGSWAPGCVLSGMVFWHLSEHVDLLQKHFSLSKLFSEMCASRLLQCLFVSKFVPLFQHPDFPAKALMANTTFRKLRAAIAPKRSQIQVVSLGWKPSLTL